MKCTCNAFSSDIIGVFNDYSRDEGAPVKFPKLEVVKENILNIKIIFVSSSQEEETFVNSLEFSMVDSYVLYQLCFTFAIRDRIEGTYYYSFEISCWFFGSNQAPHDFKIFWY